MSELKRRDKYLTLNSLVCLVKALEGKCTTIDLQNESYITGKINFVDSLMGVELEKVIYHDTRGNKYTFDTFYIKPRKIRYVHIPKEINVIKLMENYTKSSNEKRIMKKAHTLKSKRALEYQKQILNKI